MPSFDVQLEVEFEVFCQDCNTGICNETRVSRNRGMNQVVVSACPNCTDKKNHEIETLEASLEEAEEEIKHLKGVLESCRCNN